MLRLAIVGMESHSAALQRIVPRLRGGIITAVVESSADIAQRVAQQLGASVTATSPTALQEKHAGAFDAWVATTPYGLLLSARDHRPLELDWSRWNNNHAAWMWGHGFSFLPSVQTVREQLLSKKLGEPGLVRIHHWLSDPKRSAWQLAAPQLELACSLVDQAPTVVFAQARAHDPDQPSSLDYLQIHLGFADDRMAILDCHRGLPQGDDYYSLSVIASTGAAYADDHHNMQLVFGGGHPQARKTAQGDREQLATLQEFIDAQSTPRAPRCGQSQWQQVRRLIGAAERSLSSGQSVSLAEVN